MNNSTQSVQLSDISSSQSQRSNEAANLIVIHEDDDDPVANACLNFNKKSADSKLYNNFHLLKKMKFGVQFVGEKMYSILHKQNNLKLKTKV